MRTPIRQWYFKILEFRRLRGAELRNIGAWPWEGLLQCLGVPLARLVLTTTCKHSWLRGRILSSLSHRGRHWRNSAVDEE